MDVKEAAQAARRYLADVFAEDNISWVRLFFVGGPGGFCEAARQELLDPSKAW